MSAVKVVVVCLVLLPVLAWAADPTRPPFVNAPSQQVASEPLQLSMIVGDENRRHAVINAKVVKSGDWISNAQVLAIKNDHVVMTRAGRQFALRLPIAAVKTASKGITHE